MVVEDVGGWRLAVGAKNTVLTGTSGPRGRINTIIFNSNYSML